MTMSQIEKCIAAFDKTLTDLQAQDVDATFIIAALGEICAKVAKSDPEHGLTHLESLVAILDANAQAMRAGTVMNMAQAIFGSRA